MRDALSIDLRAMPGLELLSFDDVASFEIGVERADAVWLIAPECDGILERLARYVEQSGKQLIGSSSHAIHLTSDKKKLSQHWIQSLIPTPYVMMFDSWNRERNVFPVVVKPIDGCGSTATTYVSSSQEIELARARASESGCETNRLIVQPFCPGQAVSVAILFGREADTHLLPTFQHVDADFHFAYRGGEYGERDQTGLRAKGS